MPSLPLFPLGTVLLPGARLPLVLFEPRYLELARRLAELAEDDRCFGVVLIRKGHEVGAGAVQDLHVIGCEARVDAMALADGAVGTAVHLVATGVRRFRLDGVDEAAGTPFTTGLVTWLPESPVAEQTVLDPSDRQRVLEGADACTRLRTVIALLRREAAIVKRFGAVPTPPSPGGASLN